METSERMMIVGLCLQGLLSNPNWTNKTTADRIEDRDREGRMKTVRRNMTPDELEHQRVRVYREALHVADLLDPPPPKVMAEAVSTHTKTAWAVLRAYAAGREPYEEAVANSPEAVEFVFERVSRWLADPVGLPTDIEDALIRAVVLGQ